MTLKKRGGGGAVKILHRDTQTEIKYSSPKAVWISYLYLKMMR